MWDLEVTLYTPDGYEDNRDKVGNKIPKYKPIVVLACDEPVSRNEFYNAGQANIRVARVIKVHPFEYQYQKLIDIDGQLFSVVRDYKLSNEEIELTLQIKGGNQ